MELQELMEQPLAELERRHQENDLKVKALRAENFILHQVMEPMRHSENMANAGPAHLAQTLNLKTVPAGILDRLLGAPDALLEELMALIAKKLKKEDPPSGE